MQMNSMRIMKKCLCFVLVLLSLVSVICVVPETHVHAASASDYISQTYASSLTVLTTKTVNLMSMPTTASGSSVKYTIPADTVLTVTALHKNTEGKYFYKILYYNLTLYVDATATTILDHLTGDVTFTNGYSPSSLTLGNGFPIQGNITSSLNDIGKVTASMYNGTNLTRTPAITSSDTVNGKSYNLTNSTVDKNLIFSDLPKGSYSYVVTAEAVSYYIDSTGALKTVVNPVVLENQICAVTNGSSPNPVLHNGIDVSVWNGNIDWAKVKTQVDFAILRASWEETADTKFVTNANGCRDNGIPFGVYVYSYAENAAEAIGEAEYVLSLVDGYDMDLPIFFDFEDECQMNLTAAKQQEIVKAFCDTIYAGGKQPGLYTYVWLLRSVFTDTYYKTIPIWTAEINGSSYTSYKGGLWMWQWSWVGQFNGMSGDVDCNKMYVDLPNQNKSDTSYLSSCTYYPANSTAVTTANCNIRQYPSTDYTQLGTLASGTNVHVTGLYKNTYGNYWYQIEYDNGKTGYIGADYANISMFLYTDVTVKNPKMASNLAVGKGYYIQGELTSIYNQLGTVHAKIFSGENTLASPTLKSSHTINKKSYNLYKSTVDYSLNFGLLTEGYYTYEISADVNNYYINNGSLTNRSANVVVWRSPLTVGNATITPPASNVCVHNIVTQDGKVPTCTEPGLTIGTKCSLCGEVLSEQETLAALGHSYEVKLIDATCIEAAYYQYTCTNCGDTYKEFASTGSWMESRPAGYEDYELEIKTQYRTSKYEEKTSANATESGYTQKSKSWQDKGNTTITYAKTWPDGFDKSNSFYTKYNITPKTNSESGNTKYQIVTAEASANAWIYWHWCRNYQYGPINRTTSLYKTGDYTTFHAFYSTDNPASKDKGAVTDGSVIFANADACKDAYWFYNVPLYKQTYKTYTALYTHYRWSDWSDWSDTPATATDTLKVETRQVYRIKGLGDHRFSRGRCLVCDYVCSHRWSEGKCEICLMSCMHKWANGECTICKQPCTHSWQNGVCTSCSQVCTHNWSAGECTVCGIGCSHNWVNGTCSFCNYTCSPHAYKDGVCYICQTPCPGHVWQGGNCEICMMSCPHNWVDGTCTNCSAVCNHSWLNGNCGICGKVCSHNWVNGKCTVCNLICKHSFAEGVCTQCSYICTHNWHNGICTACSMKCSHTFENGVCTNCNMQCTHTWKNGICTACNMSCEHNWNGGVCTICNSVCKHTWEDGVCTICSKECKHAWYNGKCQICKTSCEHEWEDSSCTICKVACKHEWTEGVCVVCTAKCEHDWADGYCKICLTDCDHEWQDSICAKCGDICDLHYYTDGKCSVCSKAEPEYYLFGYINGKDYGIGTDLENIGTYKFEDGKLVVKFTADSFIGIKTGDNSTFYMTNGYLGDKVTSAVLYDSKVLGDKADKLFVPRGREITFTLTYLNDSTMTIVYEAAVCEHTSHDTNGRCTDCNAAIEHTFVDGECIVCSKACAHIWSNGKCSVCGLACEHLFLNDECVYCGIVCTHNAWLDGACAVCKKECAHSWVQGDCERCGLNCEHNYTDGKCSICSYDCFHSYLNGYCTECQKPCEHNWENGICTVCNLVCEHSYKHGKCEYCKAQCEHTYSKDVCTKCNIAKYYLVGYINKETVGFNENFLDLGRYAIDGGSITVTVKHDSYFFVKTSDNKNWYMATESDAGMFSLLENTKNGTASDMIYIPGGVTAEFTVYAGKNDTVGVIYTIENCIHLRHTTDGVCLACEEEGTHTFVGGYCTGCYIAKPQQDMYLFGIINGTEYGYNSDSSNIGSYKFINNTLVVNFRYDSLIGIKTKDNKDWYMANDQYYMGATSAVMANKNSSDASNLFYIPGGEEVVISIVNNGDDTYTLSYKISTTAQCTVKTKYATLSTENDLRYNLYFTVTTTATIAAEDMGLLVFTEYNENGTIENADGVYSAAQTDGGYMYVQTDKLAAQYLVDTIYMRVYVKLSDGSYAYSDVVSYSGVNYANNVLSSKYSTNSEKAKAASLLNYIAAAQTFYGYKTDSLANSNLTKI